MTLGDDMAKQSGEMSERRIVTEHVYPPIPWRQFDWCAYFDGDEESGPRGWGRTEQEAIDDLLQETGESGHVAAP